MAKIILFDNNYVGVAIIIMIEECVTLSNFFVAIDNI